MSKTGPVLAARILSESGEITILAQRAKEGWTRAKDRDDGYYLDGVALNLHGFYSALERIFEKIAATVEGTVPEGANWHQELLNQMTMEIPGIRPAVISEDAKEMLEDYRGFRHVVRNVYTYRLSPEKMGRLIEKIDVVLEKVIKELKTFAGFLQAAE